MKCFRFFLLAASASLAIASDVGPVPGICSKSPLFQELSCLVSGGIDPATAEGNGTAPLDPDVVWEGPHACAGIYCAYSNSAFAAGKGIVILSAARSAEAIANLPAFRQAGPKAAGNDALFQLTPIPGKGLGLVARQPIRRGQPIMAHTPAVVVHRSLIDDIGKEEQVRLLEAGIVHLPRKTRSVFMEQMGHFGGHKIYDIMFTNSFELGLPIEDGHHFANFPEVSRFNHDCRPNVAFYIDPDLLHVTHAVRDIAAGEELTISYVDSFRAQAVRQARAMRSWGFACTCSHCSLPAPLANASDNRLYRIYEIEKDLANWSAHVSADSIELLLSLYAQERLAESHSADAYTLAALNYNSLGKETLAVKYALLSLEQGLLENGPLSPDIAAMIALLEEPKSHWSWMKRAKAKV